MFYIEIIFAKILTFIARLINKNRNTNLVGAIMLKLDKNFLKKFKMDPNKIVVITGTNGKSTTTNLTNHLLINQEIRVISNLEGANLIGGIATTLIKNTNIKGDLTNDYFVFEVDERTLPNFFKNIKAKNLAITNLQKDQVCRNSDPEYVYNIIKNVITKDMTLYLNNNDPRSKSLEQQVDKVVYYGVSKNELSYTLKDKLPTTVPCPLCASRIKFNYYNAPNIGDFECENCNLKTNENITYEVRNIDFDNKTFEINNETITMPYSEAFMLYDYALAYAIAKGLGAKNISENFKTFKNIGGRIEKLVYKDKKIKYLRIKQENPETLQGILDSVAKDKTPKVIILGLCLIKDFKPFYSNTFYSYDCDFKNLVNSNVEKFICFSETVAYATANRLRYANVKDEKIVIINNDNVEEILNEIEKCKSNNIYLITWLHTYEHMENYLEKEDE